MKNIILYLSILALFISGIWFYQSNYDYEPLIVIITSIVGILYIFLIPSTNEIEKISDPISSAENHQNVNFNLNIGKDTAIPKENTHDEPNLVTREMKIDAMKPKTKILFIDDDKNFNVVKILKGSGWKNTKSITDIKNMSIPVVKEADIYFVDINGVGKILSLPNEGLDVALMLKQKYPHKKVVIYSANKNNNIFHEAWDICDYKLEKNALPYQFQSLVEQFSLKSKN